MKQEDAFKILRQECNVLLTGAAGSGKTFLLEMFADWARENNKRVVVTATTGIAASNINGKTIHNYSNLGISKKEQLEDNDYVTSLAERMRKPYKDAIKNTDILIIDEISMFHDYQLDAVEKVIRKIRNNNFPFGGIQVILCGDFFQLPPIAQNNEEVYFITKSKSYLTGNFEVCYLEEFWRQNKNDKLITILNAIRSNSLTDEYLILKKECLDTNLSSKEITKLYCKNKNIDYENKQKLENLSTASKFYQWSESGSEKELKMLKQDCKNKIVENLELKIGAKVMFVKNNLERQYCNGSTGEIISFDDHNYPAIKLNDGRILDSIQEEEFYREDADGYRTATIKQIPLKLAWAITIHKSQGMTLDQVAIDLANTFTTGQGYVALSRVRKIKDILLLGINPEALKVSPEALKIENELQEKSKKALNNLIIKKPDINRHISSLDDITFVTTQGINHFLYELIKNASDHLTFITPYAKLNTRLQKLLKNKKEQGVKITFVCRASDLNTHDKFILSECCMQIKNKNDLHTKCYISENEAIISSLSLYEHSRVNSDEMGIIVKKSHKIYKDILEDAERINNSPNIEVLKSNFKVDDCNQLTVIKVTIVKGSKFSPNNWRRDMQEIETDKGIFIDNLPKYGGFDWKSKEGQKITDFKINDSRGYSWLNKL